MRDDHYEGKTLDDPEIRALFTRESVLASDWYRARLAAKQAVDSRLWQRHADYLQKSLSNPGYANVSGRLNLGERLDNARRKLAEVNTPDYLESLIGMTGAEPSIPAPQGRKI
jgi:hypothetical protein